MLLIILMVEKLLECFMKKKIAKKNQEKIRTEKLVRRKGDKLYVKQKDCNNSFNSWIHEKDII